MKKLLTILGPTAVGKTELAVHVALEAEGEVLSADSRQVYREMDIGTGKDLGDFTIDGISVPYHLIDLHDAGYEYNVFEFQEDFHKAFDEVTSRGKLPVFCGGTGLYLEAVLKGYKLVQVPRNLTLREELEEQSHESLVSKLASMQSLHNTTDTSTKKRTIRAIEIGLYYLDNKIKETSYPKIDHSIYGVYFDREIIKERIKTRLNQRLNGGMIEEVESLLKNGVTHDQLRYYGLEYKFLSQYLTGELTYDEMFEKLNVGIRQFAKRQMTWYRRMEKNGFRINWIDGSLPIEEKVEIVLADFFK